MKLQGEARRSLRGQPGPGITPPTPGARSSRQLLGPHSGDQGCFLQECSRLSPSHPAVQREAQSPEECRVGSRGDSEKEDGGIFTWGRGGQVGTSASCLEGKGSLLPDLSQGAL